MIAVWIPWKVRFRVFAYTLLAFAVVLTPIAAVGASTASLLIVAFLISVGLGYLWVYWPKVTLGLETQSVAGLNPKHPFSFTFDDGPTPGLTDAILDLLRKHEMKASFFVLTNKARKAPELVKRIVDEGHVLGLHGEDHQVAVGRNELELQEVLSRAHAELEALAGQPVTLFRPSHGWKTLSLRRVVKGLGLKFCFWDIGVWDTDAPPLEILSNRLLAAATAGSLAQPKVLLLHDGRDDDPEVPAHGRVLIDSLEKVLKDASNPSFKAGSNR